MTKVQQTQQELQKQLDDQLALLTLLADSYDKENTIVAKSIATSIRVLLHDTEKSHSLLGLLGFKTKKFYDTSSTHNPPSGTKRIGSFSGLVGIPFGSTKQDFVPYLDDTPPEIFGFVKFDDYWHRIIFIDNEKKSFTRKDVVLAVANQDGGAHVDPNIDEKYKKLTHNNTLGWKTSSDGKTWSETKGSELAAVRQIGHEILRTLLPDYPRKKMIIPGNGLIIGGMGIRIGTK